MRAVLLMAGLTLALVAGCQTIEYKVVDTLPAPVFADEQVTRVTPMDSPCLAMTGNPAHDSGSAPVTNTASHSPAARHFPGMPEALLADLETHSRDNAWRWIIIHHSATPDGNAARFDREHRDKGWDELGYHFVIDNGVGGKDGLIEIGSRWRTQKHGAHCKTNDNRYNDFGIGICLVGNFETGHPTAAQLASLKLLVGYLADRYHVSVDNIQGHGEAVGAMHEAGRGTKCCGRNFDMDVFRQTIRNNRLAAAKP